MKKFIIIIGLALTLLLSFLLGLYLYRLDKIDEELAFDVEYTTNKNEVISKTSEELSESTNGTEDKINPNTKIIEKRYYNDCNHIIQKNVEVTEDMVNKNKAEFQAEYIGWAIQKFTNAEVVVYKEFYDFCDEHYLLKDVDGYINVYKLDKYGKEKELVKQTEIETAYLSEIDLENLKKGIIVYNKTELNKKLEDFE